MMRNSARKIGKGVFLFLMLCLILPTDGWTQATYPNRPITLLVGYTAGGLTDIAARAVAESASKILGQPIVISNKPGGASALSLAMTKDAKPDGYTLVYYSGSSIMNKYLQNIPYDPIKDFTPIANYAESSSGLIVSGSSPWKTHQEFIAYAKANPNKVKYGTIGPSSHYISIVTLGLIEGIKWIHVPFKGSNGIITAIMGGHIEAGICSPEWVPQVQAGRLRLLSLASSKRMPKFPNVPTWTELGFPFTNRLFCAIAGPKGMPKPIVDKISQAFKKALNDPSCLKTLDAYDLIPDYLNSEELLELWKERDKSYAELVPKSGLRKE